MRGHRSTVLQLVFLHCHLLATAAYSFVLVVAHAHTIQAQNLLSFLRFVEIGRVPWLIGQSKGAFIVKLVKLTHLLTHHLPRPPADPRTHPRTHLRTHLLANTLVFLLTHLLLTPPTHPTYSPHLLTPPTYPPTHLPDLRPSM